MLNVRIVNSWEACLSKDQQRHLRNLMLQGGDKEVCGVVFEHDIIVQYPNIAPDPEHSFAAEMDIEGVKAIWHSHPRGPNGPSDKDIKFMVLCEQEGLHWRHIIISPSGVVELEVWLDSATSAA